jgi:hypothetical protein
MKKNESINEDGHTDVASAERKLKLIMKDAMDTLNALRGLSNEDSLPSWWTDKITLAKDYVGKSRDYIMNPAESVNEISSYGEYVEDNARMLAQDYRRQDKKLAKALDHIADRINQSYPGRNKITKDDVKDIIKQPYDRKLMRPMMRFNLDDLFESVNEKKNPKREKVKKSFLKNLQKTEKTIRRIKQFAKSNQWGPISNFVEDDLVYDMMALKNEIDQIISMPVDESVNENAQKVAKLLIKRGEKPSDVKDMVKKHYKKAKKDRSKSTPSELANYISFLSANESVSEATSLGADMLLGGIATVIKKAGMRPKTAKMMGGGFKVSKRDKVGFKIDVEIRGMDKKKTFPLQFETERGMLYVVIKNKPIKLGKYTMVAQAAQNLKKVGTALIGDKDVKRIA